jgi:hypothetical protein
MNAWVAESESRFFGQRCLLWVELRPSKISQLAARTELLLRSWMLLRFSAVLTGRRGDNC